MNHPVGVVRLYRRNSATDAAVCFDASICAEADEAIARPLLGKMSPGLRTFSTISSTQFRRFTAMVVKDQVPSGTAGELLSPATSSTGNTGPGWTSTYELCWNGNNEQNITTSVTSARLAVTPNKGRRTVVFSVEEPSTRGAA